MAISKSLCSWILQGVCSTSGNIMTFWHTNFNMPVPPLFDGSSDCDAGFMAARYCSMGSMSFGLQNMCAGYEVALADSLYRWYVDEGSCLNGVVRTQLKWYRGATYLYQYVANWCINLTSSPGWSCYQWSEGMTNTGIAGWEICCNGTYCTTTHADTVSGDDVSIGSCAICLDFGFVPSVVQTACQGKIWVEGNDLHYWNANCWEHTIAGTCVGNPGAGKQGSMWVDNSHYLHWVGADCNDYRAPWRICQFCSSFTNGAPANPSPGAGYKGSIWVDSEFGYTHLSYIGCDGNKYLTGAACYPYVAP